MFEAIVLICLSGSPLCATATDVLGPYPTKAACEDRAAEMVESVTAQMKAAMPGRSIAYVEMLCERVNAA